MKEMKTLVSIAAVFCILVSSQAQNEEVRIQIPNKADFSFDGQRIQVESTNTLLGHYVGNEITSGLENTFLGNHSGYKNASGSKNTFVGNNTGYNNQGSDNVFIGNNAGANEEGSDLLYISNSETDLPLIWGDFRAKKLMIHDNLDVAKDLLVNGHTSSNSLQVLGSASIYSLNVTSLLPQINFVATNQGNFQMSFNASQDRFYMEDDDNNEVLEIKNGELSLPQYAGATSSNLGIDGSGKLIKVSASKSVYNRFEFTEKDTFTYYTRLRMGVQFQDGSAVSGIKAFIRDNDNSGSSGVQNTVFVGLYRLHKETGIELSPEVIYRIDASDTPNGVHEEFTQTTLASTGKNIIDNENYIYLIQTWYCDECSITEVELMGI